MTTLSDELFAGVAGGAAAATALGVPSGLTGGGVYMARLGNYQFSMDTACFQQLQRASEYRWTLLNRIGRRPAAQFLGAGEDTIELTGVIYPHFRGGVGQMGLMRQSAEKGEPLPFVYCFEQIGQDCGLWCIKSIKEGRSVFFRDGAPRKIEFTISLTAYGEDADGRGMPAALKIGLGDMFTLAGGILQTPGIWSGAVDAISTMATTLAGSVSGAVGGALGAVNGAVGGALGAATGALDAATSLGTVVQNAASVATTALNTATVISAITSFEAPFVLPDVPLDAVEAANSIVSAAHGALDIASGTATAIEVFADMPGSIIQTATDFADKMSSTQAVAEAAGGQLARVADELSQMAAGEDESILTMAAAVGNVGRVAELLAWAAQESAAQAEFIANGYDNYA